MSNFLIFKAAFNGSATPAIGTYTAEGATAYFNRNLDLSPDYYLYNTADGTAVQWFVPTAETTDFEFVADILTRQWTNRVTYFIIADSTGITRLRMWSQYNNWFFENSDSDNTPGTEYIGVINPLTSGGFGAFHQFRVRVRKLTASSSSVEVYVDGTLKLTATAGAALVTCAKIGFVGGVNTFGPGTGAGIKNAYVYDLSGGEVIDCGVLSGAFNRFISWAKGIFALKSDIPTVNNGTLTIQKNGASVATFTANASTNATANITVPTAVSELTNDSGYLTSSSNLDASKLTSGTVDIARLPQGALERLIKVANEAARYALTTADVQLGDTVQQLDTGIMYIVTDTDHLDSAAGYTEYTAGTAASVPWSGVTGKPTFAAVATSGAYSDLTGTPTIPTVNNAMLTIQQNGTDVQTFTANQSTNATANITVPTKTSDLTNDSNFVQSSDLATVATSGAYSDLTGTPTIPTVNNGTLTIQKNGTDVATFSANSSTNATANITVPTKTSDLTNDSGFITSDNTKIPLAGSNQISGSLIPATTDAYNLGSSSYQWNQAYIKSLTINGTACGDILTHNASEFVNVTEAQTIGGVKTFSDGDKTFNDSAPLRVQGCNKGNEFSSNARTVLELRSNRDTADKSCIYITKFRQNKAQGSMGSNDNVILTLDVLENEVRTNDLLRFTARNWVNDVPTEVYLEPATKASNIQSFLGSSTRPWGDTATNAINGINPGALSLPGSYVNVDTTNWVLDGSNVNSFTPTSDGWLGIQVTDTVYDQMHYVFVGRTGDGNTYYQQNALSPINALWDGEYHGCVFIPVIKNVGYDIRCICSTIVATFYPCQGNV